MYVPVAEWVEGIHLGVQLPEEEGVGHEGLGDRGKVAEEHSD